MNAPEKPAAPVPSTSEYILDNFKPTDRIAVLVLNRQLGETRTRITTAQKASSPRIPSMAPVQECKWSRYLCGNERPATSRFDSHKDDIEKISHVYLDLDHGGTASLEALENSDLVPCPNYVLNTSPGKFRVRLEGRWNDHGRGGGLEPGDGQGIRW